MQRHQEWLENRSYEHHLESLEKIRRRNNRHIPNTCRQHSQTQRAQQGTIHNNSQVNLHSSLRGTVDQLRPSTTQNKLSLRQQNLLENNFLLGRRIMEALPVISKQQHDEEYRRHLQIMNFKKGSAKQKAANSNFRLNKLKRHYQNMGLIDENHRIVNHISKKQYLILRIEKIIFDKVKNPIFQNVRLTFRFTQNETANMPKPAAKGKFRQLKQVSLCLPFQKFEEHPFHFNITQRHLVDESPVLIEIHRTKGLEYLTVGCFSFRLDSQEVKSECALYAYGKKIGTVVLTTEVLKKIDTNLCSSRTHHKTQLVDEESENTESQLRPTQATKQYSLKRHHRMSLHEIQ